MNSRLLINPGSQAVAIGCVLFSGAARAASDSGNWPEPPDPAFTNGLATLTASTGFIKHQPGFTSTKWRPNLQLLVGVKAVEGSKQTIRFVEVTTLPPPQTNSAGQPWITPLRTNKWNWSSIDRPTATNLTAEYVSSIYPVQVRVFDETGSALTDGLTSLPWGLLTNGLLDLCRLSLSLNRGQSPAGGDPTMGAMPTNATFAVAKPLRLRKARRRLETRLETANVIPTGPGAESNAPRSAGIGDPESDDPPLKFRENDDLMRSVGGGFLWVTTMFDQLRTVPAMKGIWQKVRYAVRLPSLWTVATSVLKGRLEFTLQPRFAAVYLLDSAATDESKRHYRLPVDMNCGKQNLAHLEIIVGPANGAEMLMAGIKSIRATHPDNPQQELMAQILASGTAGANP